MRALVVLPLLGGCQVFFPRSEPDASEPHLFTRDIHLNPTSGQVLTNFPISVVLDHDPGLRDHAATDGSDIRFFDEGHVELPSEVSYDGTTGTLDAWVKIEKFDSAPFDIRLEYGNTIERTHPATDVWSDDFVGVWHFSEDSGNALDSTRHGFSLAGTPTAPDTMAGSVGKGRVFDITDRLCALDATAANFPNEDFSFGLWMQLSAEDLSKQPLQPIRKGSIDLPKDGWGLKLESNTTVAFIGDGNNGHQLVANPPLADAWTFWRVQFDRSSGSLSIFRDGVPDQTIQITDLQGVEPAEPVCFGGDPASSGSYSGLLDEVRIYKGVQTGQWINTELTNIRDRATFMTIDDEVPR